MFGWTFKTARFVAQISTNFRPGYYYTKFTVYLRTKICQHALFYYGSQIVASRRSSPSDDKRCGTSASLPTHTFAARRISGTTATITREHVDAIATVAPPPPPTLRCPWSTIVPGVLVRPPPGAEQAYMIGFKERRTMCHEFQKREAGEGGVAPR